VLSTLPSDVMDELAEPGLLPDDYRAKLRGIEYFTALCLLIELDRRFSPYYWTNIGDDALPFVGLIEHTNLMGAERYGGRRFLYVANYLPRGHELLGLDADGLLERYTPGLRAVNPAFDRAWVKRLWLHSEPAAQPIVTVGYRDKIPPLKTPTRGLVLANTTQIFPEDRGTNYAVRLGDEAARALLDWLP
jgi:protoporphyrinogen oxidase